MEDTAFVIRPITQDDFEWLFSLSTKVDLGFTSLPNNREYLTKRLDTITKSFAEKIPPQQRIYLFVRENLPSGERVGIAGIQACAGFNTIFYNFEISTTTQMNRKMNIHFDHRILNLVDNFQNDSELISFWVDPELRGKNYGKPLSFSRMLFLAQFPHFFGSKVIAEIRGVCDAEGNSPFWEAIGRHFFGMDFVTADYLTMSTDKQFIDDLMPRMPIYVDILPRNAQQVIGITHETATPARTFLESQGFEYDNYIDIFDGGPLLEAPVTRIKTAAESKKVTVKEISNNISSGTQVIIANTKLAMRCTVGNVVVNADQITIGKDTAEILQIAENDEVRYARI